MLVIHFEGLGNRSSVGPAREIRLQGSTLYIDGRETARFAAGTWDSQDLSASAIPIEPEAEVCFETATGETLHCGTFRSLRIVVGLLYAGRELVAWFDEKANTWWLHRNRTAWDTIVIRKAPRGGGHALGSANVITFCATVRLDGPAASC